MKIGKRKNGGQFSREDLLTHTRRVSSAMTIREIQQGSFQRKCKALNGFLSSFYCTLVHKCSMNPY